MKELNMATGSGGGVPERPTKPAKATAPATKKKPKK